MQTRDEWLEESDGYKKEGYEKKGNYRKVAVLDENEGKYLVVKTTVGGKGAKPLLDEKKSKYKPNLYVYTSDDEGNPIRPGRKFIPNGQKKDLSERDVKLLTDVAFSGKSKRAFNNREKRRRLYDK